MKVIYDTCVYIEFLRSGEHAEQFSAREHVRYLSSVVMMELCAGARTRPHQKLLERLFHPYSKAQRLVTPTAGQFRSAGECLARLAAQRQDVHRGLSHDILIATAALGIGATLFTSNQKDFERIRKFIPVSVEYL